MEIAFLIVAGLLIPAAGYFYFNGNNDGAFAAGVIAVCCVFLNMRFRLKRSVERRSGGN